MRVGGWPSTWFPAGLPKAISLVMRCYWNFTQHAHLSTAGHAHQAYPPLCCPVTPSPSSSPHRDTGAATHHHACGRNQRRSVACARPPSAYVCIYILHPRLGSCAAVQSGRSRWICPLTQSMRTCVRACFSCRAVRRRGTPPASIGSHERWRRVRTHGRSTACDVVLGAHARAACSLRTKTSPDRRRREHHGGLPCGRGALERHRVRVVRATASRSSCTIARWCTHGGCCAGRWARPTAAQPAQAARADGRRGGARRPRAHRVGTCAPALALLAVGAPWPGAVIDSWPCSTGATTGRCLAAWSASARASLWSSSAGASRASRASSTAAPSTRRAWRALDAGLRVNRRAPDRRRAAQMLRTHGDVPRSLRSRCPTASM